MSCLLSTPGSEQTFRVWGVPIREKEKYITSTLIRQQNLAQEQVLEVVWQSYGAERSLDQT